MKNIHFLTLNTTLEYQQKIKPYFEDTSACQMNFSGIKCSQNELYSSKMPTKSLQSVFFCFV